MALGRKMFLHILEYFCRGTGLDIRDTALWTVATLALSRISRNVSSWKIFECNWVKEIQTYTTPTEWKKYPGANNAADYPSRGVNADKPKCLHICWGGPSLLSKGFESWPCDMGTKKESPPKQRKCPHPILHIYSPKSLLHPSSHSFCWNLLRGTA